VIDKNIVGANLGGLTGLIGGIFGGSVGRLSKQHIGKAARIRVSR